MRVSKKLLFRTSAGRQTTRLFRWAGHQQRLPKGNTMKQHLKRIRIQALLLSNKLKLLWVKCLSLMKSIDHRGVMRLRDTSARRGNARLSVARCVGEKQSSFVFGHGFGSGAQSCLWGGTLKMQCRRGSAAGICGLVHFADGLGVEGGR